MNPIVSVYIPTHNRRRLLERAVNSVLAQDYPDVEVIIVNDGSTDDTRSYLDELAAREPRVNAFHKDVPGGAPAARNQAIFAARGLFLTGLDDDDEFLPDRISQFVAHWQRLASAGDGCACLYTGPLLVGDDAIQPTNDAKPERVTYLELFHENIIGNQVFAPASHYREVGGFDEGMPAWQDLDLFIRILKRFGEAHRVPRATYRQHIEPGLARISGNRDAIQRAFERLSSKYPELPKNVHLQLYLQRFSRYYGTIPNTHDMKYVVSHGFPPSAVIALARLAVEIISIKVRWRWENRTVASKRGRSSA